MYINIVAKSEKAETKRCINALVTTVKLCNCMDGAVRRHGKNHEFGGRIMVNI